MAVVQQVERAVSEHAVELLGTSPVVNLLTIAFSSINTSLLANPANSYIPLIVLNAHQIIGNTHTTDLRDDMPSQSSSPRQTDENAATHSIADAEAPNPLSRECSFPEMISRPWARPDALLQSPPLQPSSG